MKRIEVFHISKTYHIHAQNASEMSFRELLLSQATSFFKPSLKKTAFKALDDISFDVQEGEVLGIIGKNGSGKSTLLKILSKIVTPTSGKAIIRGRVASMLEVGTGFHAELSGRENIYLSGIILGMKRWEISQQFDEIVAFAGVENFLETPVKKYSSGMRLRLAFAVATHLKPEILLIDEVLAVGDYEFEKKCLQGIGQLKKGGSTVLFVSHSMVAIQKFSSRCLVLSNGKIAFDGSSKDAVLYHLKSLGSVNSKAEWEEADCPQDDTVRLRSLFILDVHGSAKSYFLNSEAIIIKINYEVIRAEERFSVMLWFYNERGDLIFTSLDTSNDQWGYRLRDLGFYQSTCKIPEYLFSAGMISVTLKIISVKGGWEFVLHDIISFSIADSYDRKIIGDWIWKWPDVLVSPLIAWSVEKKRNIHEI